MTAGEAVVTESRDVPGSLYRSVNFYSNGEGMETLYFLNPVLQKDLQITIRLGQKWKEIFDQGCREVQICKTDDDKVLAKAKLKNYSYLPFSMIPEEWLAYEHDEACKKLDGLRKAMISAYGDKFDDDAMVTVLWFEVIDDGGH